MKATVRHIEEGTEAEYIDNGKVEVITFTVRDLQFTGKTYEFYRDDECCELWRFYPGYRYSGERIEYYMHQDWLQFLEPVQTRMI